MKLLLFESVVKGLVSFFVSEEDDKLIELFKQYGNCWSLVSRHMPQRTGTSPKNISNQRFQSNFIFTFDLNSKNVLCSDTQCARRFAKLQQIRGLSGLHPCETQNILSSSEDTLCIKTSHNKTERPNTTDQTLQEIEKETFKTTNTPLRRTKRIPKVHQFIVVVFLILTHLHTYTIS